MQLTDALLLMGGLALFLYGMHIMGEGLEVAAGSKLKGLLEKLTKNRFLGMLVGLPLGKWLHAYVMSQIRIDTIAFDVRIAWQSVVFSMLLTAVFAAIVNVVMYFKLRRISMAESLKSIE